MDDGLTRISGLKRFVTHLPDVLEPFAVKAIFAVTLLRNVLEQLAVV